MQACPPPHLEGVTSTAKAGASCPGGCNAACTFASVARRSWSTRSPGATCEHRLGNGRIKVYGMLSFNPTSSNQTTWWSMHKIEASWPGHATSKRVPLQTNALWESTTQPNYCQDATSMPRQSLTVHPERSVMKPEERTSAKSNVGGGSSATGCKHG